MPAVVVGGFYIVFGLMLVIVPLAEGATLSRIATILVILYGSAPMARRRCNVAVRLACALGCKPAMMEGTIAG
jgi:hypothetical protein